MFSGKKFRLWSKQSSKKNEDKKNQIRVITLKNEDENPIPPPPPPAAAILPSSSSSSHFQKLKDDYDRLEESVKILEPYKTKACALEKKLISATKSFERKQVRYTTTIASLESENEQLKSEMRNMSAVCRSCYFCCRHRMAGGPEAGKEPRFEQSLSESMHSNESWWRLEKLEEEQTAIVKETMRQKEETSRCLEQISSEVVKALISQKALRRDCTELQDRIQRLEQHNVHLNEVVFQQGTPSSSSSHTHPPTIKRNESLQYHSQVSEESLWDKQSSQSITGSSSETLRDEEKTLPLNLFRTCPDTNRYDQDKCSSSALQARYDYIPELDTAKTTTENVLTNTDNHDDAIPESTLIDQDLGVPKSPAFNVDNFLLNFKNKETDLEVRTSSVISLQDETAEVAGDGDTKREQNSYSRGSSFSLNDILDRDIEELQLSSSQSLERAGSSPLQMMRTQTEDLREPMHETPTDFKDLWSLTTSNVVPRARLGMLKRSNAVEKGLRHSYPVASEIRNDFMPNNQFMHEAEIEATDANVYQLNRTSKAVMDPEHDSDKDQFRNLERDYEATEMREIDFEKERVRSFAESPSPPIQQVDSCFGEKSDEETTSIGAIRDEVKESNNLEQEDLANGRNSSPNQQLLYENLSQFETSEDNGLQESSPKEITEGIVIQERPSKKKLSRRRQSEDNHSEKCNKDSAPESRRPRSKSCQFERRQKSEERKHKESEFKVDATDNVRRKREQFNSSASSSKDSDKDVNISKDKVTALTAFFEEVHAEHCPDCQHSGTKCKMSSVYKRLCDFRGSLSLSFDEDISTGSSAIEDGENIQHTDETQTCELSADTSETCEETTCEISTQEASDDNINVNETSLSESDSADLEKPLTTETSLSIEEILSASADNLASLTAFLTQTEAYDSDNDLHEAPPEDVFVPSTSEPRSASLQPENTDDVESKSTTKVEDGCLPDKQNQWKSMPSVSSSASDQPSSLQVNYVRACSLKSFGDLTTPPPSPKLDKVEGNDAFPENTHSVSQGQNQISDISDKPENYPLDKLDFPSEIANPTQEQVRHEKSDVDFGDYSQNQLSFQDATFDQDLNQLKNNPNDLNNCSQNIPLVQLHLQECSEQRLKLLGLSNSTVTSPTSPQSHYPQYHALSLHNIDIDGALDRQVIQRPLSVEFESNQGHDELTDAFPDLLSGSHRRRNNRRYQRLQAIDRKPNTLTEEDIRKYRLDCQLSTTATRIGSCDTGIQSTTSTDVISLLSMENFGPTGLGIRSSKPPLPPRRFHITKCYIRDSGDTALEPEDYVDFEDKLLSLFPDPPYVETSPIRKFSPGVDQRNSSRDADKRIDTEHLESDTKEKGVAINNLAYRIPLASQTPPKDYSWDVGKRNSYPDCSGNYYPLQPKGFLDSTSMAVNLTRHSKRKSGRDVGSLSSYSIADTGVPRHSSWYNSPLKSEFVSEKSEDHSQYLTNDLSHKSAKDIETESVFNEITKEIEILRQTVNELHRKSNVNL